MSAQCIIHPTDAKALINPSVPQSPDSLDNENNDLILFEGTLIKSIGEEYQTVRRLGSGQYGQVYEVQKKPYGENCRFAIKVSKSIHESVISLKYEADALAYVCFSMVHPWIYIN